MKTTAAGTGAQQGNASVAAGEVEKKSINVELWQTCAGPLVNMPAAGTHVVYFPQGHSEQVAASLKKEGDAQIPNYPNLPSKLLCILHNATLHADPETDEVYAQMTLQPVPSFDKEALLRSELSMKVNKPHTEFFCKTLTASDTSTHGGFSVPRRAAEKIFPPLDFTMQPPAQEIVARDLHDYVWNFRHIYRGQPKRHLLTTGWSLFVSGKRLLAGDSVLFIRDEKQQLLLGIRRANQQPTNLSSSVLSTDSMHIGILAAAAHAAANNSPFTIFYNPRTSPSEFVIPLAKYYKAVYNYQISPGMRFRMLFETEESGTRRYMGTITGVNDLDPVRWKGSQWRNIQVGWDESVAGEKRSRVSIWEIEPVTAPFFICPAPPLLGSKRPRPPGMLDDDSSDFNSLFMRTMPWLGDDFSLKDAQAMPGLSLAQWMNMKQNPSLANSVQPNYINSLAGSALPNLQGTDITHHLGLPATQLPQQNNLPFSPQRPTTQAIQQLDQLQKLSSSPLNPSGLTLQSLQQLIDVTQPPRQSLLSQTMPASQVQSQIPQSHSHIQAQNVMPQQHSLLNHQLQSNLLPIMPQQQQQQPVLSHPQQQNPISTQIPDHVNQQLHASQNQLPHQLLQNLHPQQQLLLAQQSAVPQPSQMNHLQDHPKQLLDIPPNIPRSVSASQMLDVAQAMPSQSNQKYGITSESSGNAGHPSRPMNNQISAGSNSLSPGAAACGVQPAVSDDAPSCSTSPSTNNCPNVAQSITNGRNQQTAMMRRDEIAQSSAALSKHPSVMETLPSSSNLVNDVLIKANVKPSSNIPKSQNQNFLGPQAYVNAPGAQMDCLDSSSSVTSVLSQNDAQMPPGNSSMPFNSQPMFFRDARQNGNVQDDPRSNAQFGSSIENQFGMPTTPQHLTTRRMGSDKDFLADESCGEGMLSSYQNGQDTRPEPSSSMVSQSFGVPDMTFNSIDSTINDGSFMNASAWAPPQIPRMRTFTKVYKRGAVGRSIDITRYSGYNDLKQDLARRFGIEGQLEDRQKIGWKLVYVDHENDVLLVGDDPWEEFVNCVRCIKILSPQEVQQMSLDGDFGSNMPLNPACSSSEIIG